jgi:hypothetical protein
MDDVGFREMGIDSGNVYEDEVMEAVEMLCGGVLTVLSNAHYSRTSIRCMSGPCRLENSGGELESVPVSCRTQTTALISPTRSGSGHAGTIHSGYQNRERKRDNGATCTSKSL